MHARWVSYIQWFTLSLKQKSGKLNRVVETLSHRAKLLVTLQADITRFECLKELFETNEDFVEIWRRFFTRTPAPEMHIQEDYLF
jgi:hypothetical protein